MSDEKYQEFIEYHKANPQIWKNFERFAIQIRHSGRLRYGAKSIMERVRWEVDLERPGQEFKINNNFTSFYAREFIKKYPDFSSFFETREKKNGN